MTHSINRQLKFTNHSVMTIRNTTVTRKTNLIQDVWKTTKCPECEHPIPIKLLNLQFLICSTFYFNQNIESLD